MRQAWEWRCCRLKGRGGGQRVRGAASATGAGSRAREGLPGRWARGASARRSSAEALAVFRKCHSSAFPLTFLSCTHSAASRCVWVRFSGYRRALNCPHTPWHDSLFAALSFTYYFFLYFLLPYRLASGILVPRPGVELGPWQGEHGVLTTRPPGNSLLSYFLV